MSRHISTIVMNHKLLTKVKRRKGDRVAESSHRKHQLQRPVEWHFPMQAREKSKDAKIYGLQESNPPRLYGREATKSLRELGVLELMTVNRFCCNHGEF